MAKDKEKSNGEVSKQELTIPNELKELLTSFASRPPEKSSITTHGDARSEVLVSCNEAIQFLGSAVMHIASIANSAPNYQIDLTEQRGL